MFIAKFLLTTLLNWLQKIDFLIVAFCWEEEYLPIAACVMFFYHQVEVSCPKEMAWKVNMYRGYLAICHPEEQQLSFIERLVEMASSLAIREWRRLPHVVSHVHTPLLQVGAVRQCEQTEYLLSRPRSANRAGQWRGNSSASCPLCLNSSPLRERPEWKCRALKCYFSFLELLRDLSDKLFLGVILMIFIFALGLFFNAYSATISVMPTFHSKRSLILCDP